MAPFEKDEWVLGLMVECGSFINMTNNCMESINGKLKEVGNKVISHHNSLQEFIIL